MKKKVKNKNSKKKADTAQSCGISTARKFEERKEFEDAVKKLVHDICSPLASLKMYIQTEQLEISEQMRVTLTEMVEKIKNNADGILSRYRKDNAKNLRHDDIAQVVVLSLMLSQANSEKRYEYQEFPVEFNFNIEPKNLFTSVKVSPFSFKRMISNLINNAVNAFDDKEGEVNINLESNSSQVRIIIEDKGKGVLQDILEKISNQEVVLSGKQNGYEIGMLQVKEDLQKDNGLMTIDSKVGVGTKIILTYPKVNPPEWIVQEINLSPRDIVVILDSESSTHKAWNLRLKKHEPKVTVKHFTLGVAAQDFINRVKSKDRILLLLSDYHLLKQHINGLKVIDGAKIQRAILVTCYHNDHEVLDFVAKHKMKILPKSMVIDVPINMLPR